MQAVRIGSVLAWRHSLMFNGAAVLIQQWWHIQMRRKAAAIRIQSVWAMYVCKRSVQRMREEMNPAATVIQSFYRRVIRLRYWRVLVAMALEEEDHRLMGVRNVAAARIQRYFRQHQVLGTIL